MNHVLHIHVLHIIAIMNSLVLFIVVPILIYINSRLIKYSKLNNPGNYIFNYSDSDRAIDGTTFNDKYVLSEHEGFGGGSGDGYGSDSGESCSNNKNTAYIYH